MCIGIDILRLPVVWFRNRSIVELAVRGFAGLFRHKHIEVALGALYSPQHVLPQLQARAHQLERKEGTLYLGEDLIEMAVAFCVGIPAGMSAVGIHNPPMGSQLSVVPKSQQRAGGIHSCSELIGGNMSFGRQVVAE